MKYFTLLPLVCMLLLISPVYAAKVDPDRYVVTLETSREPLVPVDISLNEPSLTYVTSFRRGGELWYRLRIGFFTSRKHAEKVLSGLIAQYPAAWATRVPKKEKRKVMSEHPQGLQMKVRAVAN